MANGLPDTCWITRDESGAINGVYALPQMSNPAPQTAVSSDDPEVTAFLARVSGASP